MAAAVGRAGRSAAPLGAGIAGVELLTAFPCFAVIALVVGSSDPLQTKFLLLLLYNVVYALPLFAIVFLSMVLGSRADPLFERAQSWVLARWPVLVAPLAIAAGAVFYNRRRCSGPTGAAASTRYLAPLTRGSAT